VILVLYIKYIMIFISEACGIRTLKC